jgi:teichuronic acid biosynthesis glycosyltransferase TuaG
MNKLVSIIVPSYNSAEYISDTIESVLNQSYNHWEMIIVDDGSSDHTLKVIQKFVKKDIRIKLFINENNSGPAISRNRAIKESKGRFIAFLDSDDLWLPDKLSLQIDFMIKNNFFFSYSYYSQINEKGNFIKNIDFLPKKVSYYSTMKSNKIGCLTAVYDIDFFGKVYMENLKNRQDYTLWLKLLKKVDFAYCVPVVLAKYRVRDNSISSSKLKLINYHWIIYRHIEKKSFFKSLYYISNYIFIKLFIHK